MDYIEQGIAEVEAYVAAAHWCPDCPDHDPPARPAWEVLAEQGRDVTLPDGTRVRVARGE